jgi:DNA mismatch repair ATPase MutS
MSYLELMKKLCKENKGYIVIIRSGVFFTAIGANAIKLSELFGLKLLCISEEICKCSFPSTALERYIIKFQKSNYSYLIYDYKKEGFESGFNNKLITRIDGKLNEEERNCLNCTKCSYNRNQKINLVNKTLRQINELLKEDYKEDE